MSKKMILAGRVLTGLVGLFLITSGLNLLFIHSADLVEGFVKFGYPASAITPIGLSALLGGLLYVIPQTTVLGAIILTGYLGGAVATHVRISDPVFVAPLVVGMLVWLGVFLRDERLRAMLPLRRG